MIGTIHGDHNRFPLFNLESLRIALEHISPDLVIIEEDPKTYAQKWYEKLSEEEYGHKRPIEIRKVIMPYVQKKGIKAIPVDDRKEYDEDSPKLDKELELAMNNPKNKHAVETLVKGYEALFLDDYLKKTIYDFQSDTFMAIIDQYQELARLNPVTKASQELSDRRQSKIDKNIIAALQNNRFKRAVIFYGVTHRPAIVRAVKRSNVAQLMTLDEAMKPKVPAFFDRKGSLFFK